MQSTRRTILLSIVLVAMLAIAGCGGGDDPTPTPVAAEPVNTPAQQETTNTDTSSGTTAQGSDDPVPASSTGNIAVDAVAAALRKQVASLPMRMTVSSGAEGEAMTAELVSPERFHVNAGGLEILMVDGTVYMRQGDAWIANDTMGAMANAIMGQYMPENIEGQIATIVSAEQLPDETVNGEAASVYSFTVNSPLDGEENVVSRVYVRKSDGLPIRVASAEGAEDTYQVDYAYDPSIVIEPPQ